MITSLANRHSLKQVWLQRMLWLTMVFFLAAVMGSAWAQDQTPTKKADDAGLSLITETPEEGFALAVKLSQKGVATTQTDANVRKELRPNYAHDPNSLIAVSHVIATHFQTVAAANDYWRK